MMKDLKLKPQTWVVVADGEKALFLINRGDAEYPNLDVFREEEHDNPPAREWAEIDIEAWRERFRRSPVKRVKYDGFLRNMENAARNADRQP